MCRSAYVVDVVDVAMPVGGHASCHRMRARCRGGVIRRVAGSGERAARVRGRRRQRQGRAGLGTCRRKLSNWATARNSNPLAQ
jgi:hypothetical protein